MSGTSPQRPLAGLVVIGLATAMALWPLAGGRVRADVPPTPQEQIAEGRRLFPEETFGGNGRTCATCHVAALNFRLTPANIAQRFATLDQTFDPLFIAEPGMNLNTLTVDAAVAFPPGAILAGTSAANE